MGVVDEEVKETVFFVKRKKVLLIIISLSMIIAIVGMILTSATCGEEFRFVFQEHCRAEIFMCSAATFFLLLQVGIPFSWTYGK